MLKGIRWWVPVLAAILAALVVAWVQDIHFLSRAGNPSESVPPAIPVIAALLLGLFSLVARRFGTRLGLFSREVIFIYVVLLIAAPVAGIALMFRFIVLLTAIPYTANPANELEPYVDLIPRFWCPHQESVIENLYRGLPHPADPIPWNVWVVPILFWTFFFTLFFFCLLCLMSMLRRQWVDRERLVFPLAALPIEFFKPREGELPFYRNRLFWLGSLLSFLFILFRILNHYIEFIPGFSDTIDFSSGMSQRPWTALRAAPPLMIKLSPTVIGLTYLIKQEISLSIWVTLVIIKVLQLGVAVAGFNKPGFPFLGGQAPGALMAFAFFILWLARGQVKDVFWKAMGKRPDLDDSNEPLPHRVAFFGFIGGTSLLCLILKASGMHFVLALSFFFAVYVMALTYARFRAEAGSPFAWGTPWAGIGFAGVLLLFTGWGWISQSDRVILSILNIFTIAVFPLLIATQMEAFRMADGVNLKRRYMTAGLLGGVLLAIPLAFVLILQIFYTRGANYVAEYEANVIPTQAAWAKALPPKITWLSFLWPAVGALVTAVLVILRFVFLRFPIHPLGYVIMMTRAGHFMVGSVFIAWIIKKTILKYGGVKVFRKLVPLFVGLVIGELGSIGLWFIIVKFIPGVPYLVAWG